MKAAEQRPIVAHGGFNRGFKSTKTIQAPAGAAEPMWKISFAPAGACSLLSVNPRLAPWAIFFRLSEAAIAPRKSFAWTAFVPVLV
jgi:hypothetical protein